MKKFAMLTALALVLAVPAFAQAQTPPTPETTAPEHKFHKHMQEQHKEFRQHRKEEAAKHHEAMKDEKKEHMEKRHERMEKHKEMREHRKEEHQENKMGQSDGNK